jgi:hypothetical protein
MKEQLIKCLEILHAGFELGLKKGVYDSSQVKDIIMAHETLKVNIARIKEIKQPDLAINPPSQGKMPEMLTKEIVDGKGDENPKIEEKPTKKIRKA